MPDDRQICTSYLCRFMFGLNFEVNLAVGFAGIQGRLQIAPGKLIF